MIASAEAISIDSLIQNICFINESCVKCFGLV